MIAKTATTGDIEHDKTNVGAAGTWCSRQRSNNTYPDPKVCVDAERLISNQERSDTPSNQRHTEDAHNQLTAGNQLLSQDHYRKGSDPDQIHYAANE